MSDFFFRLCILWSHVLEWWHSRRPNIMNCSRLFMSWLNRFTVRATIRSAIGITLAALGEQYPALPTRFPVLWDWYMGWTAFTQFTLKAGLGFFGALFTGTLGAWWAEYDSATHELINQFISWLTSLTF